MTHSLNLCSTPWCAHQCTLCWRLPSGSHSSLPCPGMMSQITHLHRNPGLRVSFWGSPNEDTKLSWGTTEILSNGAQHSAGTEEAPEIGDAVPSDGQDLESAEETAFEIGLRASAGSCPGRKAPPGGEGSRARSAVGLARVTQQEWT